MNLYIKTTLGLRILFWMALQPERRVTRLEFSAVFPNWRNSIRPPLETLAASGLIVSRLGVGGGYMLNRHPQEITLLEAIRVLEGEFVLDGVEANDSNSLYVRTLGEAKLAFFKEFEKLTVADIVKDADSMKALGIILPSTKNRDRRRV